MSNDTFDSRIRILVAGLIDKTKKSDPWGQELVWERVGIDTYDLTLSATTISIGSEDGDGNYPYFLRIIDEDGREIEKVTDTANDVQYRIDDLYRVVLRTNSKLDQKLSEIMKELGIRNDDEPPF